MSARGQEDTPWESEMCEKRKEKTYGREKTESFGAFEKREKGSILKSWSKAEKKQKAGPKRSVPPMLEPSQGGK